MTKYIFSNLIGSFVFDEKIKVVEKILFDDINQYIGKKVTEDKLKSKNKDAVIEFDEKILIKILDFFKDNKYYSDFYKKNLELTKQKIRDSVKDDILIIQAINNIDDIEKSINILVKRLRDWYSFYNPETEEDIESHEKFVELVLKEKKEDLLKHLKIKKQESMGADFSKEDLLPIKKLAEEIQELYEFRKKQESYLESLMKKLCPNLSEVAGYLIGAKLIEIAGSLKHLVIMPSSTIQLLGAEKALFRHIRNKKNLPPKFGILFNHTLVQKNISQSGKVARALADSISIAVKVDYFKGQYIGDKLKKQLEEKFKN